jgi:hypothetical protein
VVNSPRASGEVGGIGVAIHRSSPRRIGRSGPVVVDSDKRALGTEAKGKKRLLWGDKERRIGDPMVS